MKERFFATEAQNDRSREPTPDKVGGDEFVILSETKDLCHSRESGNPVIE